MAQQRESRFKVKVLKALRMLPNSWWVKIQQASINGTPDILGCLDGQFFALELKRDAKARVSRLQDYILKEIERGGGISFLVYPENWAAVYDMLKKFGKEE